MERSKYTDDQRTEAATQYAIKGSLRAVERQTDIPNQTLSGWSKTEWWDDIISTVRAQNADQHIAKYLEIVSEAQQHTLAKLPEATAAQASIIAATATDKARLLMNQPTSISAKTDGMAALAQQFAELSSQMRDKEVITVVEMGPIKDGEEGQKPDTEE